MRKRNASAKETQGVAHIGSDHCFIFEFVSCCQAVLVNACQGSSKVTDKLEQRNISDNERDINDTREKIIILDSFHSSFRFRRLASAILPFTLQKFVA